jgi:hypothetical protein
MADLDPRSAAPEDVRPRSSSSDDHSAAQAPRNGTADARAAECEARPSASAPTNADGTAPPAGDERDDRSGLEQAEEIVDHLAERIASWTGVWGRKLLRLSSRARESAQDFWAEVQDFRHGKRP